MLPEARVNIWEYFKVDCGQPLNCGASMLVLSGLVEKGEHTKKNRDNYSQNR
jgi:hypothetical protein